jgi:hypothetical protein
MVKQLKQVIIHQLIKELFQLVDELLIFQRLDIQLFLRLYLLQDNQQIYQYKHMEYVRFSIQRPNNQSIFFHVEYIQFFK